MPSSCQQKLVKASFSEQRSINNDANKDATFRIISVIHSLVGLPTRQTWRSLAGVSIHGMKQAVFKERSGGLRRVGAASWAWRVEQLLLLLQ